ncbi:hypothetical protein HK405_006837 [Cladochytrium tenue]|nr:hypothetical protein HK405_006837 [Cladochytrium tenue]
MDDFVAALAKIQRSVSQNDIKKYKDWMDEFASLRKISFAPNAMAKQQLAYAVCDFLTTSIQNGTIKEDDTEGIAIAIQCIGEAFGFDYANKDASGSLSVKPATLQSIFDVFLKTQKKLAEIKAKAEALKAAGNKFMAAQQYKEAIDKYTEAIALDASNAVYFANRLVAADSFPFPSTYRAAAYSQDGDHASAVEDAKRAIEVDPDYSKAYSRMGHAYFCLNEYSSAVDAYERGLRLDPGNQSMKQSLSVAKDRLGTSGSSSSTATRSDPAAAGGGPGGLDFASMLNNPNFMNMASQMMSNPAISQMLNNPAISQMAQNLMSNPSELQNLLSNPDMARMAASMAGGSGSGTDGGADPQNNP